MTGGEGKPPHLIAAVHLVGMPSGVPPSTLDEEIAIKRLLLVSLVLGLWLPACNQASEPSELTGAYRLVNIDGHELPYTPSHEGGAPQVVASTLTLNADGTFRMSMSYGTTPGNSISRDFSGTYTSEGAVLNMLWKGAGKTTATFQGNTLTLNNEGILFAYQK